MAATKSNDERIDFEWEEVVPLLLKSRGISRGLWSFGVKFNFGAANVGAGADEIMPTAITSIRGLSLRPVSEPGPLVFDASLVKRAGSSDENEKSLSVAKARPEKVRAVKKAPAKKGR